MSTSCFGQHNAYVAHKHIISVILSFCVDYIVLTSVDRDDIPDGGSGHFAQTVKAMKRGIKKKAKEQLSVLCDVDVVAIAYDALSDPHSEVWPDDPGVHGFLDKYHGRPVLENTLNQEELIQKRLHKVKEYLKKRSNENFEEEISQLMINYMAGYADPTIVSENALHLKMLVEQNLKEIDRVMEESGKEDEVCVPVAPPMCEEGLLINGENENGQTLHHHDMGSGNWNSPSSCWNDLEDLEYYMGFGSSEMP
ncbi:agamous-like MADS-box protein AGL80 [Senna tora]|uniref:Agamous-like MADS-box protein AGL80 n=1 Tax=Senna tora TaxID=362788 RepID=A0A834WEK1_9FABA|nr:agamous-like MADS-box protein AGL80 [Senna tora]